MRDIRFQLMSCYCITTGCVPDSSDLRHLIMDEFHRRPYVGHLGYQKMVTTVRQLYYWPRMKYDIPKYIAKCLECQQVKVEHKHPTGLL
jgi:hypothetical protein